MYIVDISGDSFKFSNILVIASSDWPVTDWGSCVLSSGFEGGLTLISVNFNNLYSLTPFSLLSWETFFVRSFPLG